MLQRALLAGIFLHADGPSGNRLAAATEKQSSCNGQRRGRQNEEARLKQLLLPITF